MMVLGGGGGSYERGTPVGPNPPFDGTPVRVVHLGRSTWHAISGRGDLSGPLPTRLLKVMLHGLPNVNLTPRLPHGFFSFLLGFSLAAAYFLSVKGA